MAELMIDGLREHWEPMPSFFSLYGPLLPIGFALGMLAGTALAIGGW